jgi:hypothetical protein
VKESIPEPEIFFIEGHQIRGYELLKRKVSQANKYAGRIVVPVDWIGATVKVILGGEVYVDYVRPSSNQGRLNVKYEHIQKTAWVIRTDL